MWRGGTTTPLDLPSGVPQRRAPRCCTVFVKTPPNEHTSEGGRDGRGVPYHAESTLSSAQVLTRWHYVVGFSGTDTGEEGGAQGRGHRTHELISHPAPGAVARASAGVLWTRSLAGASAGHRPAGRALSRIRDPRRLSDGADRALGVDHRVLDGCPGEAVQLRHIVAVRLDSAAYCRSAACGTPAAARARGGEV